MASLRLGKMGSPSVVAADHQNREGSRVVAFVGNIHFVGLRGTLKADLAGAQTLVAHKDFAAEPEPSSDHYKDCEPFAASVLLE